VLSVRRVTVADVVLQALRSAPMSLPSQCGSRRSSALLILALAAVAVAGCGSSHSSGTQADPAGAVPASTPLYASATVRPGEPLKAAARTAGQKLSHQADVYLRLLAALQTPGSPALTFDHDVAPWLGTHAAIFLGRPGAASEASVSRLLALLQQGILGGSAATSAFPFGAKGVDGAIVLDTSDATKAQSFLQAQAARAGGRAATYKGVSYQTAPGAIAFGVVDRFAVIGSESGLRSVIDTTLGGPSLAHSRSYAKLLASAPSGVVAHLYANSSASGLSHGAAPGSPGLPGLLSLLAGNRSVNVSLVPSAASIALDADVLSTGTAARGGLLSAGPEGAQALGELPGESWLAVGLGNVGKTLGEDVRGLHTLASIGGALAGSGAAAKPSSGLSVNGLLEGILAPLSALGANTAEAKRDFASWMGSAGMFASGSGLLELRGGIVIGSKNPTLSRAAVAKLAAKLRESGGSVQAVSIAGTDASVAARLSGLPVVLDIADGRDTSGHAKFVIGLGEPSIAAALNPSSTLAGAASRAAASASLGEGIQPSVTLDFPTLVGLLESVGLSEDPSVSPFVPYLRSLTTLAGGGKSVSPGVERFRLVVGLR
jgi:Protein of unknown function (DUF3352)